MIDRRTYLVGQILSLPNAPQPWPQVIDFADTLIAEMQKTCKHYFGLLPGTKNYGECNQCGLIRDFNNMPST